MCIKKNGKLEVFEENIFQLPEFGLTDDEIHNGGAPVSKKITSTARKPLWLTSQIDMKKAKKKIGHNIELNFGFIVFDETSRVLPFYPGPKKIVPDRITPVFIRINPELPTPLEENCSIFDEIDLISKRTTYSIFEKITSILKRSTHIQFYPSSKNAIKKITFLKLRLNNLTL